MGPGDLGAQSWPPSQEEPGGWEKEEGSSRRRAGESWEGRRVREDFPWLRRGKQLWRGDGSFPRTGSEKGSDGIIQDLEEGAVSGHGSTFLGDEEKEVVVGVEGEPVATSKPLLSVK